MKIGFIGIGQMGRHMSRHVLEAGHDLVVHDLKKEAARHLLDKGAAWADTPAEVARLCPVVITCLPGPPEVEAVVYGDSGLAAGWKEGDIYIDMSTDSPTLVRRIAGEAKTRRVAVLDAPVSGGAPGAERGTLTIMAGGDAATLETVRPVLEAMGKNIFHVGEAGCGNIAKLVNNIISAACNAITAEGLVLGVKAGIDLKKLWEVIRVSTGNNFSLEHGYPNSVFKGNFEPGFRVNLALKDIGLALALGKEVGVPQPLGRAVEERFLELKAEGLGEKGIQSVVLPLERAAGVQLRLPDLEA